MERQCSKLYGVNLQLKDITDFDECKANTGRLFSGCLYCEIRKCIRGLIRGGISIQNLQTKNTGRNINGKRTLFNAGSIGNYADNTLCESA